MNEISTIVSIFSGVLGGVMIIAFLWQFERGQIALRIAEKEKRDPSLKTRYIYSTFILPFLERKEIWKESKGMRFLLPVGAVRCGISYLTYSIYIK